jgi:alpha,alpha-trehalose phosphorylase
MDLDDLEHNTRDGVHLAALAGAWIALVQGFGGMRTYKHTLAFAPRLPAALHRVAFRLCYRQRRIQVTIHQAFTEYALLEGAPLQLSHHGEMLLVSRDAPVRRTMPPDVARPRPSQPPGREPPRRRV